LIEINETTEPLENRKIFENEFLYKAGLVYLSRTWSMGKNNPKKTK
jgi:hypothetical protein